jgi:hypothetical protein
MCGGDLRHFGEVLLEQTGEVFSLEIVCDLGEVLEFTEEHGEFLALCLQRHVLMSREDRLGDLRREVLGQL